MAQQKIEITVVDKTARALNNISKRLTNLNKGLLGVNRVAGLAAGALASIGGGLTLRRIIRVSAEFQDLRTTLTSVTGSAQEGAKAFDFLTDFATQTQFSTQALTTSFIKLKTAGIEPTKELLTTFTDAAAVTTDQIGTLQAITDLFSRTTAGGLGLEEINRLTDRGLPALDILQEKLGLNRLQISEFGKSAEGARIITEALAEGIRERFGGATEARLNNLSVQFSNLSIAIDNAADKVGRGGLNAALGDLTKRITNTITENDKLATELGEKLAGATIILGDALAFAVKNLDVLAMAALGFIGLKITLAVLSLASAFGGILVKGIGLAIIAMKGLRLAAIKAKVSMATLLGPISLVVYGLTELATSTDFVKKKFGLTDDAVEDLNHGLGDNASFTDKVTAAIKKYTGVDAPGYINNVSNRLEALTSNQEEMNEATKKFNELKKTGSVIDQDEINRLKQKPKTFAEVLVAQQKLTNDAKIALETNKLKQTLLKAEIDLGRELSDIEKEKLIPLIRQTQELQAQNAIRSRTKSIADEVVANSVVGYFKEQAAINGVIEKIKERNDVDLNLTINALDQKYKLQELYELELSQLRTANAERLNKKIEEIELTRIRNVLRAQQQGYNADLTEYDKQVLQKIGANEKQEEIVRKRIEFEKKSELEKGQFALEQANTLFTGLGRINKKFFAAQKAIAIAQAVINTYQGATKALATYPPPFNFIAAAATVASGLAQVATIRAQQYQRGGSPITGQPAIVGEDGPELIVPKQPSTVIPNEVARAIEGMGGGDQGVNVNFNITTTDARGFDELLVERRSTIVGIINQAMNTRGRTGVTA